MKKTSRLFGPFTYTDERVIRFPEGLLGFPDYRRFVLKSHAGTAPIRWLLSVDENGPELALIDPALVAPMYEIPTDIRKEQAREIADRDARPEDVLAYAVVTLPENIRQMSMNLRAPLFIDLKRRTGIQRQPEAFDKKPVRCPIYRDLIASRPEDRIGQMVLKRKVNETVEIGEEISIQVMEIADGGVRLGINAPRSTKISRGDSLVTPTCETARANADMNLKRLEGVMRMHQIMSEPQERLFDVANAPGRIERAG